jgi:hypothetical protein
LHYFQAVSSSGHTGACVFPQLGRIFLFNWEIPPNVKLDMWCISFDVNARICDFRILMPDLAEMNGSCAYFIGTSSHCVFSNTIQNLRVPDQELAADGG